MRLYLNDKESKLIKFILMCAGGDMDAGTKDILSRVIERITLCEQLQRSENKSK